MKFVYDFCMMQTVCMAKVACDACWQIIILCKSAIRHSVRYSSFFSSIFSLGWPKHCFKNFGKCNLGEYPLPPVDESFLGTHPRGSGHFPKLPKRICATQQGHDFGTVSFTAKPGLSCCISTCLLLRDVWVKP